VCLLRNHFLDKRLPSSILSRRRYLIVCTAAALITPLIYLEQGFSDTTERYRLIDVLFRIEPVDLSLRTLLYFPVKFVMTIVCVTLPLPVGLFSPVFLLGGVLGRILGMNLRCISVGYAVEYALWNSFG
jgi:H+/Cl- antiporter ClcA